MKNTKFYICEKCGNLVELIDASGAPLVCCGQKMTELKPEAIEASREKHIPEYEINGNEVKVVVGSVLHPMAEEHSILWVAVRTDRGIHRKELEVGRSPEATFALHDEKPLEILAYCNLHGLWKKEINQ